MRRALALSVGTGTGPNANIVEPLKKAIGDVNPEFVCFLASSDSEKNAMAVASGLRLTDDSFQTRLLDNPDDVEAVFKEALQALRGLVRRGYGVEEIAVDFTSGTKAMTAGLVLAATAMRCGSLRYITGARQQGTVASGTERFLSIPPAAILAYRELEVARELIRHLQFRAALDRCEAINPAHLDPHSAELNQDLAHLACAYDAWDKFDHRRAAGELGKVDFGKTENAEFRVGKEIAGSRLPRIGQAIEQGKISDDLLADLANNALRRRREGKYDDAVARLYRLVEMLGQRTMERDYGLRSGDLALEKVPETLRAAMEQHRNTRDGKVKIGLAAVYGLLAALGSSLGAAYEADKDLPGLLKTRNESILAHGTRPVSPEACLHFCQRVLSLLDREIPGFAARRQELQFPWLRASAEVCGP